MKHFPSLKLTFPQHCRTGLSIIEPTLSYHSQYTADIPNILLYYQSKDGIPSMELILSGLELIIPCIELVFPM